MVFDLSSGEVVHIGDGVTLTILAVEGDSIQFGLESEDGCPAAHIECGKGSFKPTQGPPGSVWKYWDGVISRGTEPN
jgi:Global regulator protein family